MSVRVRARARKKVGPLILNISRSGITPSVKIGRVTHNLRRHTTSIDTPGIGSVMVTPNRQTRRKVTAAELLPEEVGLLRVCDPQRGGCGAEPGDVCRTPTKRPAARMHKARRTPDPIPVPRRSLAFRVAVVVGKILGLLVFAFPKLTLVLLAVAVMTVWVRLS